MDGSFSYLNSEDGRIDNTDGSEDELELEEFNEEEDNDDEEEEEEENSF